MAAGQGANATALASEIERQLREVGRPERAEAERRYLKSDLDHLGVSVPAIREIATVVHREKTMSHDELIALVGALWARPLHERRVSAVELLDLGAGAGVLSVIDAPLLQRLLRESRTWALVDPLAVNVIGVLADREPAA